MGSDSHQRRLMGTSPVHDEKTVKSNCAHVGDSHTYHTGDHTVLSMRVVSVRIRRER